MEIILPLGQSAEQCAICNNTCCKACHTDKTFDMNCPDFIQNMKDSPSDTQFHRI